MSCWICDRTGPDGQGTRYLQIEDSHSHHHPQDPLCEDCRLRNQHACPGRCSKREGLKFTLHANWIEHLSWHHPEHPAVYSPEVRSSQIEDLLQLRQELL